MTIEGEPEDLDTFLEHFGVLGMKWGVRKSRDQRNLERRQARRERGVQKAERRQARVRKKVDKMGRKLEQDVIDAELADWWAYEYVKELSAKYPNTIITKDVDRKITRDELERTPSAVLANAQEMGRQVREAFTDQATVTEELRYQRRKGRI